MRYCPQCGYEYHDRVATCPDCSQTLQREPPQQPSPPSSQEPLVVVYEAPDEFRSNLVKGVLEEAGLPVIERVDRTFTAYDPPGFSALHGRYSRLLTLKSRAVEAKRIVTEFLAAYERGDFALSEEE